MSEREKSVGVQFIGYHDGAIKLTTIIKENGIIHAFVEGSGQTIKHDPKLDLPDDSWHHILICKS